MTIGPNIPQERRLITAIPGPKSQEIIKRRNEAVSASLGMAIPVVVEKAGGGVIVDVDGNSIIDMGAGIAVVNVGNSADRVVENVINQVKAFTHTCFMIAPYLGYIEVCEALNRLTPGTHKKKSVLLNSGAEAVENAIKIARAYTKRQAVVVFEHGYHGRTNLTMAMTAKNMPYKEGFGPFASEIYRMPMAYPFRFDGDAATCSAETLEEVTQKIEKEIGAKNVAAIVIEPIQGEGGFIVPAPVLLTTLQARARNNNVLMVADEVQSGVARTGKWFASEWEEGFEPDLFTIAKGIAGGMPISAVTGRAEIMDASHPGGLGGTFGGNPVAAAAAVSVLKEIEAGGVIERAQEVGKLLSDRLNALKAKYPVVGDVRGHGAMMAIEFVEPGTLNPNKDAVDKLVKHCHSNGVLILNAGTYYNVIRFLPPLAISDALLNEAIDVLEAGIAAL